MSVFFMTALKRVDCYACQAYGLPPFSEAEGRHIQLYRHTITNACIPLDCIAYSQVNCIWCEHSHSFSSSHAGQNISRRPFILHLVSLLDMRCLKKDNVATGYPHLCLVKSHLTQCWKPDYIFMHVSMCARYSVCVYMNTFIYRYITSCLV